MRGGSLEVQGAGSGVAGQSRELQLGDIYPSPTGVRISSMPEDMCSSDGRPSGLESGAYERERVERTNDRRAMLRGYLVFATDPERVPDEPGYREVFVTEAKTPGEARAKVRPLRKTDVSGPSSLRGRTRTNWL